MHQPRPAARGPEMGRWIMVAALILAGVALYFVFAPSSVPVAPPDTSEAPDR